MPRKTLADYAVEGNVKKCKALIADGAYINFRDKEGWTPLSSAALVGHGEICELLIAAGADVNKRNEDGNTPLYWAASNRHTEVCTILIAAGADPYCKCKWQTPAEEAMGKGGEIAELFKSIEQHKILSDSIGEGGPVLNKLPPL